MIRTGINRRKASAMLLSPLALQLISAREIMTSSEFAHWEMLREMKRIHYVDRLLLRNDLRRRQRETESDDRDNSTEAHNRLAAELTANAEILQLIETEINRLERELAELEKFLKSAAQNLQGAVPRTK